jgi:hypothetical protein
MTSAKPLSRSRALTWRFAGERMTGADDGNRTRMASLEG